MKKLTISERVQDWEFSFLERTIDVVLPIEIKSFFKEYAGMAVKENMFQSPRAPGGAFYVNEFLSFTDMHNLSKNVLSESGLKYLAFAIDPNGMYYFISFEELDFLSVKALSIDISEDYIEIAKTFDIFISQLEPEPVL